MNKEFGAMVVCDGAKCTGCRACELACFASHGTHAHTVGMVVTPVQPRLFVEAGRAVICRHCEAAPCMAACRKGAIAREGGQVVLHSEKCADCSARACASACPFGCIRALPGPEKCDLCGGSPACVAACPNGALTLVDPEQERDARSHHAAALLLRMR